jgi:hypothetical protein
MNGNQDDFDVRQPRQRDEVEVDCQCGHRFAVPPSLKGGLTNCPHCRRTTSVPGGPEPLFWFLLVGGIIAALVLTALFGAAFGPTAGAITLGVCALIILVLVLAS